MEILIIIFLILINGIFSMSEIALVSSKKYRLEAVAKKGDANAKKALDLANNPNRFLSTVQFGITLIGILTGIFSGEKITEDLTAMLSEVGPIANYSRSFAVMIVVIIVTFLSIVFGELIPKRIGLLYPETIASFVARPMNIISIIASPFIWLLTVSNSFFLKLFGIKGNREDIITEEEIKAIVRQGADMGEIQKIEHNIVDRVFALGDRKVAELMTHRSEIVWLDIRDDIDTIRKKVNSELHSFYPVAEGSLDKTLGIVNVKEMFAAELKGQPIILSPFVKEPLIVHENIAAYLTLEKFRERHTHNALVVDEYGAVQGIITMDDILDALVGDVSENRLLQYTIEKRDENSWLIDGQYPFFELINFFDIYDAEEDENDGDYNTIGGLVLHLAGRIPSTGEVFNWKGFSIEVLDLDGYRIDKVLFSRMIKPVSDS